MSLNDYDPKRLEFAMSRSMFLPMAGRSGVFIGHGCSIGPEVVIGDGTVVQDRVVIMGRVSIGAGCLIKPGTVIGAKGFSFGFTEDLTPVAIGHSAGVHIGNRVEVGALCTICQGTIEDTVIENDVKMDDHIHIAHNCHIGEKTIITAGVIFGGGVVVGKACWFGLNATVQNKVKLADRTVAGTGANVIKDSEPGDILTGNPATVLRKRD